jgi:hypothetical protein
MSDAVAHAVLLFSKRNFDQDPLVNPALDMTRNAATESSSLSDDAHEEPVDQ